MDDDEILATQRWLWSLGDYAAIARRMAPVAELTVARLELQGGERVLDVATGDGNAAVAAARAGAEVTGVDLCPEQLDLARSRMSAEGVEVTLVEGDAQALDFSDESFDAVVSSLGAMFAPDADRAARELARVCRIGGRVAVASWTDEGWMGTWRRLLPERLGTGSVPASPSFAWQDPAVVRDRLHSAGIDATTEVHELMWSFDDAAQGADFYLANSAPFVALSASLESDERRAEARRLIIELLAEVDVSGGTR